MLFQNLLVSCLFVAAGLTGTQGPEPAVSQPNGYVSHVTLYRNQALVTRTIISLAAGSPG